MFIFVQLISYNAYVVVVVVVVFYVDKNNKNIV